MTRRKTYWLGYGVALSGGILLLINPIVGACVVATGLVLMGLTLCD